MPPPLPSNLFSITDTDKNRDLLLLIIEYLNEHGLSVSATVLRDEAQLSTTNNSLPPLTTSTTTTITNSTTATTTINNSTKDRIRIRDMAILEGDWETLKEISKKIPAPRRKAFLYAILKQEFLELVNGQESQLAFAYFNRCLKPLESFIKQVAGEEEFFQLLYLTTCKSVRDATRFQEWNVTESRVKLVRILNEMSQDDLLLNFTNTTTDATNNLQTTPDMINSSNNSIDQQQQTTTNTNTTTTTTIIPPNRLMILIQQAYAYQILISHTHPSIHAKIHIDSLLRDYSYMLVPNGKASPHKYVGGGNTISTIASTNIPSTTTTTPATTLYSSPQQPPIKCLTWVGSEHLAAGSNNGTFTYWRVGESQPLLICKQQQQRAKIWDVACSRDGKLLGYVHSNSHVTLRSVNGDMNGNNYNNSSSSSNSNSSSDPCHLLCEIDTKHRGDVYNITFMNDSSSFITSGFDHTSKQFDVETSQCIKTFSGHTAAVTCADMFGNLVVTGSKDRTVMFFDISSGVCVRTLDRIVGEVTSIQLSMNGERLLIASKDSTHRIFDIRTGTCLTRFKGAVNSSKSFLRANFGSSDNVVLSGSENGSVLIWDAHSGSVLQTLKGHHGPVYRTVWNDVLGLLASCSDDGTVRCWKYHE
jgi:COMPASS component SWD3